MKKNRLFVVTLILGGLLCLSSCASLFNDDDMEIHNSYNSITFGSEEDPDAVKAGGVVGKEIEEVPNALCFKSISYATDGSILNTYKVGGVNHTEYNVNNGEDYSSTKSKNNYDLYVPNSLNRDEKHTVILFIHGGAWVSGFKTQVNQYVFEFANRGYITATIKYSLLKRTMDDSSLSIFRNLDEIDACIKSIKSALNDLHFDTSKTNLVIGGASSGSHLAMLYAYSRGHSSALPIRFIVDAVGPVDIKPENWKCFKSASDAVIDNGVTYEAIEAQKAADNLRDLPIAGEGANWNEYQTMRIANGMCGIPYSLEDVENATDENKTNITNPNAASISMTKDGGGEDQLSVTYWINHTTNRFPIICAYAGKDYIVGIAQYAKLEKALDDNGIDHQLFYFRNSSHTSIGTDAESEGVAEKTAYKDFLDGIDAMGQSL